MPSKRERILQAWKESFENHPERPPELNVHRYHLRPIEVDRLPAMVVYPRPADMQPSEIVERRELGGGGKVRRTLALRLEFRARAAFDEPPDGAVDPYYSWAVKAVHEAEQLDGLLMNGAREQSSGFGAVETEDAVLSALVVDYELHFETTRGNPDD